MTINITWKKLDKSDTLDDYFRHKVEHLEHFDDPILSAELSLRHDRHHKKGRIYEASARLAMPKETLVAKEMAEHPNEAIDLLVQDLRAQLADRHDKKVRQNKRG